MRRVCRVSYAFAMWPIGSRLGIWSKFGGSNNQFAEPRHLRDYRGLLPRRGVGLAPRVVHSRSRGWQALEVGAGTASLERLGQKPLSPSRPVPTAGRRHAVGFGSEQGGGPEQLVVAEIDHQGPPSRSDDGTTAASVGPMSRQPAVPGSIPTEADADCSHRTHARPWGSRHMAAVVGQAMACGGLTGSTPKPSTSARGGRRPHGWTAATATQTATLNAEGPHRKRWGPSTYCPVRAMAEDTRFELVRGCPQHAFQACALGH